VKIGRELLVFIYQQQQKMPMTPVTLYLYTYIPERKQQLLAKYMGTQCTALWQK
jgi:hypothetical protein